MLGKTPTANGSSPTLTNAGDTVSKNINPTSHWQSTYKNVVNTTTNQDRIVSRRPTWSVNRVAYSSGRGIYKTEFQESFGSHGHNPRNILPNEASALPQKQDELTVGTSKVTSHIPGYNGFIPAIDINEQAVSQSKGSEARQTIIKQNIVENYNVKVPGYSGHKPMSVVNDRGQARGQCLSTEGEKFC